MATDNQRTANSGASGAQKKVPARSETTEETALNHLGVVLYLLAELSPNDRCPALDEALAFYNAAKPDARIEPNDGWITKLVHIGPMDWPARRADGK